MWFLQLNMGEQKIFNINIGKVKDNQSRNKNCVTVTLGTVPPGKCRSQHKFQLTSGVTRVQEKQRNGTDDANHCILGRENTKNTTEMQRVLAGKFPQIDTQAYIRSTNVVKL